MLVISAQIFLKTLVADVVINILYIFIVGCAVPDPGAGGVVGNDNGAPDCG